MDAMIASSVDGALVGSGKRGVEEEQRTCRRDQKRSQMVVFGSFGNKISPDDRSQDGGFSYCDPCTHKAASAVAAAVHMVGVFGLILVLYVLFQASKSPSPST